MVFAFIKDELSSRNIFLISLLYKKEKEESAEDMNDDYNVKIIVLSL